LLNSYRKPLAGPGCEYRAAIVECDVDVFVAKVTSKRDDVCRTTSDALTGS
jgi:hypothetical protein